jgi:hypothetical protein
MLSSSYIFLLLPATRHVEFEKDDVPVLNHIGFPLLLVFSSSLGTVRTFKISSQKLKIGT